MATWMLDRPVEVNHEGNVIVIGFRVTGLPSTFVPSLNRSTINATIPTELGTQCRVGPIVGWRISDAGRLFYRARNDREPAASAVSLTHLAPDGSDWLVDVAVRYNEAQFIAINAGADKIPSGTTDCYVQRVRAGVVVLRPLEGSDPPEPSGDLSFADGVGNQSIRLAAEKIGRLPGWSSGTPTLRVHGDVQAERVRRTEVNPGAATIPLSEWENLRVGEPAFTGSSGSRPDVRTKGSSGGNPYIRYVEDGASTDQTRLTLDAAAAGLNVGSGNVTFGVVAWSSQSTLAHLIGRWNGPATPNSSKQWRIVYDPTTSPQAIRIDFARSNAVTSISTPLAGDLSERTLIMYRASTGIDASWEVWINGELVNGGSPLPLSGNTGANKRLTIGARGGWHRPPPELRPEHTDRRGGWPDACPRWRSMRWDSGGSRSRCVGPQPPPRATGWGSSGDQRRAN